MSKLQQNGRHSSHAFVLLPCHVCDELVKLHGLEFHVRKSIIEEAKTPPRALVCELSTTEEQHPIRTLIIHFLIQLYQRRKTSQFFWTVYLRHENETSKFPGEVRKNTFYEFPGAKVNQLNHYVTPT